jgi:O-6-methylguanine DNA methyltransferase
MFSDDFDGVAERLGRRLGETAWRREADPVGAVSALEAYFEGDLDAPAAVPLEIHGTPFQRSVWSAMQDIPAGVVASYGEVAFRVGAPRASRAVGAAAGANLIALVIPCHRVVASGGGLGGYGGGLDHKRWLLDHEQEHTSPPVLAAATAAAGSGGML